MLPRRALATGLARFTLGAVETAATVADYQLLVLRCPRANYLCVPLAEDTEGERLLAALPHTFPSANQVRLGGIQVQCRTRAIEEPELLDAEGGFAEVFVAVLRAPTEDLDLWIVRRWVDGLRVRGLTQEDDYYVPAAEDFMDVIGSFIEQDDQYFPRDVLDEGGELTFDPEFFSNDAEDDAAEGDHVEEDGQFATGDEQIVEDDELARELAASIFSAGRGRPVRGEQALPSSGAAAGSGGAATARRGAGRGAAARGGAASRGAGRAHGPAAAQVVTLLLQTAGSARPALRDAALESRLSAPEAALTARGSGQAPATAAAPAPPRAARGRGQGSLLGPATADGFGGACGGDPAAAARQRLGDLLRARGANSAPEPESRAPARGGAAFPPELLAAATEPGDAGTRAMRLLELQVLQELAGSVKGGGADGDAIDFDEMADPETDMPGGVRAQKGTASMERIRRVIEKHPERWCRFFDQMIEQMLYAHLTNPPWSPYDYVLGRVRCQPEQEDLQRFLHPLASMHAVHRQMPGSHWALNAFTGQAFKACEQAIKDKDWTLGWRWTGLPDPRPNRRFAQGLTHPSEHAAGLAYLRELQTLEQHRLLLSGKGPGKGDGKGGWGAGAGGGGGGGGGGGKADGGKGGGRKGKDAAGGGGRAPRRNRRGQGEGEGAPAGGGPPE